MQLPGRDPRIYVPRLQGAEPRPIVWETTILAERTANVHLHDGVTEDEFVEMRTQRDATLAMPKLILPSLQVNIRAGHLPEPEDNGVRYLKLPVNVAVTSGGLQMPSLSTASLAACSSALAAALMLLGAGRIAGVSGIAARATGIGSGGMSLPSAWPFLIGLPLGALSWRASPDLSRHTSAPGRCWSSPDCWWASEHGSAAAAPAATACAV